MSNSTVEQLLSPTMQIFTTPDVRTRDENENKLVLHDLLSIGEFESALALPSLPSSQCSIQAEATSIGMRLPLLVRWLHAAQSHSVNLSSLAPLDEEKSSHLSTSLPHLDSIIPLLEDIAAAHPDADDIELLVSVIAPSLCNSTIGNVSPLSRCKLNKASNFIPDTGVNKIHWNTKNLDIALSKLPNKGKNKKRGGEEHEHPRPKKQRVDSCHDESDLESSYDDDDVVPESTDECERPRTNDFVNESLSIKDDDFDVCSFSTYVCSKENDSLEYSLRKTLQDLILLVKSSFESNEFSNCDPRLDSEFVSSGREKNEEATLMRPGIFLKSDSIFLETDMMSSSMSGCSSFLSIMVPLLMHHAPVLRHEHVACALCRSAAPQAPDLFEIMASNCPAAISCLLRGAINAYNMVDKYLSYQVKDIDDLSREKHVQIMRTSIESAKRISLLSRREAFNTISMLREHNTMHELVLSLLIEYDYIGAAAFIVETLMPQSSVRQSNESTSSTVKTLSPKSPSHAENCHSQSQKSISSTESIKGDLMNTTDSSYSEQKATQPTSLRERMVSRKKGAIINPLPKQSYYPKRIGSINLHKALIYDKTLADNARICLSKRIILSFKKLQSSQDISDVVQNNDTCCLGEIALLIQAYAILVHCIGLGESGSCSAIVADTIASIGRFSKHVAITVEADLPKESSSDQLFRVALSAAFITCSKICSMAVSMNPSMDSLINESCYDCLQSLLLHPTSMTSTFVSSLFAGYLIHHDSTNVRRMILKTLYPFHNYSDLDCLLSEEDEINQISNTCDRILSHVHHEKLKNIHNVALSIRFVTHDPTVAIYNMHKSDSTESRQLDVLMKNIFSLPSHCEALINTSRSIELIRTSIKMLLNRPEPHIPLILPLSLDHLARSIPWNESETDMHLLIHQFALQLLYALLFLKNKPKSPFTIHPRSLPLKPVLFVMKSFCNTYKAGNEKQKHNFRLFYTALKDAVSTHCPDIVYDVENTFWLRRDHAGVSSINTTDTMTTPSMVYRAICDCLDEKSSIDPSGMIAEKMFLSCRSSPSDVHLAVVRAILSTEHDQPKFFSYMALCKDPLILLKARASVWKCRGVRCILLKVLQNLMEANECLIMENSETRRVALQFLAARDSIIVRCVLFACQCGFLFGSVVNGKALPTHCLMSVYMIRSIASRWQGMIASLIRQGLAYESVDWLVKFIPESFLDAPLLTSLLSQKGSLTASERLNAAEASLRIAVSYFQMGEAIAAQLVKASLAVLVDSFHLVIGPVGVPVSLLREDNGQNVTSTCRNVLFRMIGILSTINPRTTLKDCAISSIGKIVSLCRNQGALVGVSGVFASKRKALLNDIYDACSHANTALGCVIEM